VHPPSYLIVLASHPSIHPSINEPQPCSLTSPFFSQVTTPGLVTNLTLASPYEPLTRPALYQQLLAIAFFLFFFSAYPPPHVKPLLFRPRSLHTTNRPHPLLFLLFLILLRRSNRPLFITPCVSLSVCCFPKGARITGGHIREPGVNDAAPSSTTWKMSRLTWTRGARRGGIA
jgi:hypothetical protein